MEDMEDGGYGDIEMGKMTMTEYYAAQRTKIKT
jgi:hypothetical protein